MIKRILVLFIFFIMAILAWHAVYCSIANAEETELYQGVELIVETKSPLSQQIGEGNRGYMKLESGEAVPIQRIKAKDYIPPGEIMPMQAVEDADRDGNTDYVIIRTDTRERKGQSDE